MERDGKTRVYITSGEPSAWRFYPDKVSHDQRLVGEKATEVLDRADFHAVNSEVYELLPDGRWGRKIKDEWGVYPKPEGAPFRVDRSGWKSSEYESKLAEVLEEKTGKKGLTITVS